MIKRIEIESEKKKKTRIGGTNESEDGSFRESSIDEVKKILPKISAAADRIKRKSKLERTNPRSPQRREREREEKKNSSSEKGKRERRNNQM